MRLSLIRLLPMIALLFGVAFTVSGCNTVAGTVGGVGKDISMIGNTLTGVVSDDCGRSRCDRWRSSRDGCGRRACRERRVVSRCGRSRCDRGYRTYR